MRNIKTQYKGFDILCVKGKRKLLFKEELLRIFTCYGQLASRIKYVREMAKQVLVLQGKWLYDNSVYQPVQIFVIDYDYYYEMAKADEQLEPGEEPGLNEKGEMYMIKWDSNPDFLSSGTREYGGLTLEEAKKKIEKKVSGVVWE
jgi:hypothetical protein